MRSAVEAPETVLRLIGYQLDREIYPSIRNGGIVMPSSFTVQSSALGKVSNNDKTARQRRSKTRPWEGASGRQGSAGGSGPSSSPASVIVPDLKRRYEGELDAVQEAYPGAQFWLQGDSLWLLTESALLPGLQRKAVFLTAISYRRRIARSWGFWGGFLPGFVWIGARHTNFPDGSICAFEPTDRTWCIGDSAIQLLDLYTLWALRQLHLEVFKRWPGRQVAPYAYERIIELQYDEHCGCGSNKLYGECCGDQDLAGNRIADAVYFLVRTGGLRKPPAAVVTFVNKQTAPPNIEDLLG